MLTSASPMGDDSLKDLVSCGTMRYWYVESRGPIAMSLSRGVACAYLHSLLLFTRTATSKHLSRLHSFVDDC